MKLDKTHLIVFLVGVILGLVAGFFVGKGIYDQPLEENITRDTVIVHDTIVDVAPIPKDSVRTRWITRWLPAKRDTSRNDVAFRENSANSVSFSASFPQDSVAVEIPITSKHYGGDTYDAWVSGFEPSLDSIKVYRETQYITETIEKTIKPKRKPWGIGFHVGYGYDFQSKTAAPFVGVGISYDIISF